ncbi:DNA alkylation repair protein [uncultured Methanomethylovorans sp.]|uniref:DNA alkylation repair protein n=1 Tax=uncultured Methanomethylovorans sp. TaxID=183759 RepID=UPI002AA81CEA|nr:DNA alkylation repair protein [uncultured Methanomethylovorans sp.]
MYENLIFEIRVELTNNADEKTKDTAARFFKEGINCYGVKAATAIKIADKYFKQIKNEKKDTIFSLSEELLKSDLFEESSIAFEWVYRMREHYEPNDFEIFERWIGEYVNNWAKCDTLCNHSVAAFIESYPHYMSQLKQWTKSENRWFRRAAAVTLVLPARNGKFQEDVLEIADSLLMDEDDLVRKGYGWMLKEAGKAHQQDIFEYVMKNKKVMPRTSLRYAIEKFPQDMRKKAMEK